MENGKTPSAEVAAASAKAGDTRAFSELVNRYSPMLHEQIRRYDRGSADYDEAYSEAIGAFYRAVMTFDPSYTLTFGLYAKIVVHRAVCAYAGRKAKEPPMADSDVERLAVAGGAEASLIKNEEWQSFLAKVRASASDLEYGVFVSMYVHGESAEQTARRMERTVKSVENAKDRLMRRLREHPERFGVTGQ